MEPADSIRRIGFARWYERRLIEGHAWFVSAFLCLIAVAASVEELNFRSSAAHLLFYTTVVIASCAIGAYGLRRYQRILSEAETLGEQATCGRCGAYARFRLVSPCRVRCKRCENEWRLIGAD